MDPAILFPEILNVSLHQINKPPKPSKSRRRRFRQKLKKLSVSGAISVAPLAMEVEDHNRHQMVAHSAVKMKEAPPSSTQPLQQSRDTVPSSGKGVMMVGVVQPPLPMPPSMPPMLSDSGGIQLLVRGSKNSSLFSDDSLSASRIEMFVDSLTTKKKRKGSDSSLLVGGRYDLRSRALR